MVFGRDSSELGQIGRSRGLGDGDRTTPELGPQSRPAAAPPLPGADGAGAGTGGVRPGGDPTEDVVGR
jgi:hypothetical protein